MKRTATYGRGPGFRLLPALLGLVTLAGCATRLPTYPPMSGADSLRVIAERLDSVTAISASADLTLTNAAGQTVSLDGAFVAQPPDRARLRAWKFGSPVLDLTILPEGVWAYAASRDGSSATDMTRLPATGVSQSLELLSGKYFSRARVLEEESTNTKLVAVGMAFGRDDVRCEIDRATLTPRRFAVMGDGGTMELALDRYALVGEIVWPRRMEFRGANEGTDGIIVIRLGDLELNGELAESAFVPSGRAARLP